MDIKVNKDGTKQDDPIYCSRCGKVAGYLPQEVWHLCGGHACSNCAEKSYTARMNKSTVNNQTAMRCDMSKTFKPTAKRVTFTDAKPGDRVWSLIEGWGVIKNRYARYTHYPLNVEFEDGSCRAYTLWGLSDVTDLNPTLFWDEIQFETPEKPPQLQNIAVDAKVIVWDQGGQKYKRKYKRHFSHFDAEGRMFAFNHGHTSFTSEFNPEVWVTAWDHWELVE